MCRSFTYIEAESRCKLNNVTNAMTGTLVEDDGSDYYELASLSSKLYSSSLGNPCHFLAQHYTHQETC